MISPCNVIVLSPLAHIKKTSSVRPNSSLDIIDRDGFSQLKNFFFLQFSYQIRYHTYVTKNDRKRVKGGVICKAA